MERAEYLSPEDALPVMANGEMELLGLMPRASNYTFAAVVATDEQRGLVIYKPQRGETPLYDFPEGSLFAREVAAYIVSDELGWGLVPPTIARAGEHGVGSVQMCVDAEPTDHYLTIVGGLHDDALRRVCALDLIINNADRKSGHVLVQRGGERIWVIDHGVCFHVEEKLRTVIWDFAGERLPTAIVADVERFIDAGHGASRLAPVLAADEIDAVRARAGALIGAGVFPHPPEDRRPYPWPPV